MGHTDERVNLDSHTVMYGVFGHPVHHSRSPMMLNAAFQAAGLNAAYAAFHVHPERIKEAVEGIRGLQLRGVNITIPHKVEVMQYLDEIDDSARTIGAVNTIVNEQGKLTGYNTDGIGYVRALKEETGLSLENKRILLIGAGGAARGVGYGLSLEEPYEILIANRTEAKADALAEQLSRRVKVKSISFEEIAHYHKTVDLVINTTAVGMHPHSDAVPIKTDWLHEGVLVSDIIYTPRMTRLLTEAQARGAQVHSGLGMFIYQGAYAFEYWTGKTAPIQAMRAAAEAALDRSAT